MLQTSFTHSPSSPHAGGDGWKPLAINGEPLEAALGMEDHPGLLWLDSAVTGPGSVSILGAAPGQVLEGQMDHDWEQVELALTEGLQKAAGGLAGWVGFDGRFRLGVYDGLLRFTHDSRQWGVLGRPPAGLDGNAPRRSAAAPRLDFRPLVTREEYAAAVRRAQEYIAAGDIYQVNLSHPWFADWPEQARALELYQRLRKVSPAPHAAFVELGDSTVLSASPELFLKMDGPVITTRPIKGTRPRFPGDPERDAASARELPLCEKERAELLMITDLERNDLGQVCEFGSVQTPDLWRVEGFAQVYHLVSTVTGRLKPGISHAAAFRACFPGGSISGAPKRRALEVIAELEGHPRGLYTGAIGFFGFDGSSQWNIAIRTAVKQGRQISFHAGSGIVADSIPEREWEETLHKASGLLTAWS
ncbi:MAG: Isochorismate synthase MenF [Prosthecobacter sp.]|nr:Isochorismate synthase MenF [Prosthecobacter sp.]